MRRYLLDTGRAGDYVHRRQGIWQRAQERARKGDPVGICTPVLGELHAGVELSTTKTRNRDRLRHALGTLFLWPVDQAAAEEFGRLFALLRKAGRPMQQIDIQVAAVALSLGKCTVVSTDSDFSAIPGLKVESWAS